ncbi:MAG: SCO6745 family protein, partial [Trebonia sp.]
LWLAATVLREHRGDGHVLAAVAHGLRGLDATVTFAATGAISRAMIQPARGWTDEDWEQSSRRLVARGLLDSGGRLTKTGGALRRDVEELTDRLAAGPVERVGSTGVERAIELATPISRHLMDTGVVPIPNPIGAPRP